MEDELIGQTVFQEENKDPQSSTSTVVTYAVLHTFNNSKTNICRD